MEPLAELLATNERQALEFFLVGLKDVSDAAVDQRELLYNASVLAHYAQVSTHAHADMPTPASLATVFDQFVVDDTLREDSALLETAATQCLLLSGFFESQMRHRHNIRLRMRLLPPCRVPLPRTAPCRAPGHHRPPLRAVARALREAQPGTAGTALRHRRQQGKPELRIEEPRTKDRERSYLKSELG